MKSIIHPILSAIVFLLFSHAVKAQFPYRQSFMGTTANGLVVSGSAQLTAATGIDPVGQGYLRLTDNSNGQVGYAYVKSPFPSTYGLTTTFEFFAYKSDARGYNQADGISFFLFDASVNTFRPGGLGGSLGYAQYYSTPGMAKGYLGVGIDEFGNFSSASDGRKNGGPGQTRGSIAIRGPGNGSSTTDYVYQTGVAAGNATYNAGFLNFTQRYPDTTSPNYRLIKIVLTPGSSLGANKGYTVTVIMYKGGVTLTPVTLINNFDYPFIAPSNLQFGFAASTGAQTDFHEIRNINITPTNSSLLVPPTLNNDAASICQGGTALLDITANDVSNNTNGSMNKATVDLDPSTSGIQTTFTDPGKGTYSVDQNGIVTFTPVNGFSGNSVISYNANDTYGLTSITNGTITVTVNNGTAPSLTITNPAAVCSPQKVDITNPALRSNTTAGASYDYFSNLTDANNNANNIDATANVMNTSSTYYIRAFATGCATLRPVVVQINQTPTTASAGGDQCTTVGGQNPTLLSNNPDVGTGTWTQVSGPGTATIAFPNSSNTPVSNLQQGAYTLRWTISNGACLASTSDMHINVGLAANAGTNQSLCNGTSPTLQGSDPTPGTGAWTQVSGPSATIGSPTNPLSAVTGLTGGNAYVFKWTVTNSSCTSSSQVTLTKILNTVANAGQDQVVSGVNQFTLNGNSPDAGNTGTWTLVSVPSGSTPAITQPNNPITTVTSVNNVGDYSFKWTMVNGSCSNSSNVKFSLTKLLPVAFLSFTATQDNEQVILRWQTATENNNDHFVIERSENGIDFSAIGTIAGSGTSSVINNYVYDDAIKEVTSPSIYYRLQQVDRDGKSSYSAIIKIALKSVTEAGYEAWPNPFKNYIRVKVYCNSSGTASISLYDNSGKLIRRQQQQVTKGYNSILMDQLSANSKGLFILEVRKDQTMYRQKLIKE